MRRLTSLLLAAFVLAADYGCVTRIATTARSTVAPVIPPPSPLEARVEQYWARRQAKDLSGAYEFYCAGYRSRVPREQFLQLTRLTRFDLMDIHVVHTQPAGQRAQVTIAYRFAAPMVSEKPVDGQATETWGLEANGSWCKEDEPVVLPFPKSGPGSS